MLKLNFIPSHQAELSRNMLEIRGTQTRWSQRTKTLVQYYLMTKVLNRGTFLLKTVLLGEVFP